MTIVDISLFLNIYEVSKGSEKSCIASNRPVRANKDGFKLFKF